MRWEKQKARSDGLDDAQRATSSTVELDMSRTRPWFLDEGRWDDGEFAVGSGMMGDGDDLGVSRLYIPGVRSTGIVQGKILPHGSWSCGYLARFLDIQAAETCQDCH